MGFHILETEFSNPYVNGAQINNHLVSTNSYFDMQTKLVLFPGIARVSLREIRELMMNLIAFIRFKQIFYHSHIA